MESDDPGILWQARTAVLRMYACAYTHTYILMNIYVCIYMHAYMLYIHTYIHIHIYTCIHVIHTYI